jgi:hypothetical protein
VWLYLGAFAAGFASEFLAEVWAIRYTTTVNGRYARVPEAQMRAKVASARKWGLLLFALGLIDTASVLGGPGTFAAVSAGAGLGGYLGIGRAMWHKYWRLNGGKPEEGEDED